MRRASALIAACLLAAAVPGSAGAGTSSEFAGHHRQVFRVVIVRGLSTADLPLLARHGAVGLLVPNAGPRTSGGDALAGMVRGILYNARLPRPTDSILIRVEHAATIPRRGPAIVVGMPPQHVVANTRRYPIAVLGAGYRGVLVSKLTRVTGLVSMADVARTALATANRLGDRPSANAAGALSALEARVESSRGSTMAASVLVLVLLATFALFLPAGAAAAIGAALAANLALGWIGAGPAPAAVTVLGLFVVAGGLLGARFARGPGVLGGALVVVVSSYAVAMLVAPAALSLAPIGPELTSRFFGVSNLLEMLLLAPALLAARLLFGRFGWPAFGGIGVLALLTIAENRLGADGGGALVVGVAFAVLAVRLGSARRRLVVPALGVAALAVFALLDADAASNSPDHLRAALDGGITGLARVAANRVPLAYARIPEQWYLVFPAFGVLAVGLAAMRSPRPSRDTAVVVSLLAALGVSLLVNDSPGAVTIAGLTGLLSVEGGVLHRELAVPLLRRLLGSEGTTVRSARLQE